MSTEAWATADTEDARRQAASEIGGRMASDLSLSTTLMPSLKAVLEDGNKKKAAQREGACFVISEICSQAGLKAEPFLTPLVPNIMKCLADKDKIVRAAAEEAILAFGKIVSSAATVELVPMVLALTDPSEKWQTISGALKFLSQLAAVAPTQLAACLPSIVPVVTGLLNDAKEEVKSSAVKTMKDATDTIDNMDVKPLMPNLLDAIPKTDVEECIHQLASTTFVQVVEAPAMAIISPLLVRGFAVNKKAVKRACAVICANMSKLVEDPAEAAPFLPKLIPCLEKATEEVSDPEARTVCAKALAQLESIRAKMVERTPVDEAGVRAMLAEGTNKSPLLDTLLSHCVCLVKGLVAGKCWEESEWQAALTPFLAGVAAPAAAKKVIAATWAQVVKDCKPKEEVVEEDDAEVLCDCRFTLAYGSKILLHNTSMKLVRGKNYGLLGGNDSGKTTLMRAIANGQLEDQGFPSADDLRTVFVEADILGEMSHLTCADYIFEDDRIKKCGATREEVLAALVTVGFSDGPGIACYNNPVQFLSGGWRMKLALARAMLQKADILLLDEPTNHLDVINVQWVKDYLNGLTNVTSIIVSHDSGLLNDCCSYMMAIGDLKLRTETGNLSAYVKRHPEAMAFFELKESTLKFKFPQPGYIEGVKSKGKALMKMDDVTFTYPCNQTPTIAHITVRVSLSSRVACVGVNGAGKSTMIKLLTGELEPQTGEVWKHPSLRIGYIAQHAFHHIENHLNKTANEYIQWRYQNGDDKEALVKVTMQLTEAEEAQLKAPVEISVPQKNKQGEEEMVKVKKTIEKLTGSRKNEAKSKDYLYEVKWLNSDTFTWCSGAQLEKFGSAFCKLVKSVDEKIASRAGMYVRPLTGQNVEQHLEDVGLDKEFGTHARMAALSGGQKVKVVLAAAMWNQPHILILDEPTNYLDREALGALAGAIEEFEGGVVMITHNNEFCSKLCPETWVLENGLLDCKGDPEWMKAQADKKVEAIVAADEFTDAMGNTVKIKAPKKKLSKKEKLKAKKMRDARRARGEDVTTSEEDE